MFFFIFYCFVCSTFNTLMKDGNMIELFFLLMVWSSNKTDDPACMYLILINIGEGRGVYIRSFMSYCIFKLSSIYPLTVSVILKCETKINI